MKVLVVDDSKVIRLLIEECVGAAGHSVIHAENGDQAVALLQKNEIDLVLMDVEMPGMNGFQTTEAIRKLENLDWFPIIFLTTKQDDDSFSHGIMAGGDAYLAKPINPLRLQMTIKAMERIYLMRQKLQAAQKGIMQANKELEFLAMYDQLTQLANRRNFDETLLREFKLAKRNKTALSLIICDIDFFKVYNDTYGHQKGDECLQLVAKTIGGVPKRPTDIACRYGGEEFTIILPDTVLQGSLKIAEQIRQAVLDCQIPHQGSKVADSVSLSLGLTTFLGQVSSTDELIKAADDALYRAKENGRNRVES